MMIDCEIQRTQGKGFERWGCIGVGSDWRMYRTILRTRVQMTREDVGTWRRLVVIEVNR